MNNHFRPSDLPMTTQAAEGLERRRWSVAEIEAMVEAGVIEEDERFELIGGEVVPMSPKGSRHELVKIMPLEYWMKRKPDTVRLAPETAFRVDHDTYFEPDLLFVFANTPIDALSPASALLVVEVSDSSFTYDLGRKARLYAVNNVRELWVVDAVKLETHVHRRPSLEGYLERQIVPPDQPVVPGFSAELAITMGNLRWS